MPSMFELLKSMTPTISVGMVTADLLNLGHELKTIEEAGVKLLHVDVMDGCFCPSMTVGPPLIKAMKTPMLKDVHLMIAEPLEKLGDYVNAGADIVTFQVESTIHPHRVLQALGTMKNANDASRGIVRGAALNPGTPVETVAALLDELEMVMLLAVNPGWGGQQFIASTEAKVKRLQEIIRAHGKDILLCIDGGIKRDNIAAVAAMGADIIVTGSAVFDGKDPAGNAKAMLAAVRS